MNPAELPPSPKRRVIVALCILKSMRGLDVLTDAEKEQFISGLFQFSPLVESEQSELVFYLDMTTCLGLYGHSIQTMTHALFEYAKNWFWLWSQDMKLREPISLDVSMAVSRGKWLARSFALYEDSSYGPIHIVLEEELLSRLAKLPLKALPLDKKELIWLQHLGLTTLSQVMSLPRGELYLRLQKHSKKTLAFLNAEDNEPLQVYTLKKELSVKIDLDFSVQYTEQILFFLFSLCKELEEKLRTDCVCAGEFELVFQLEKQKTLSCDPEEETLSCENGVFHFKPSLALREAEEIMLHLKSKFEGFVFSRELISIELRAKKLQPIPFQKYSLVETESGVTANKKQGLLQWISEVELEVGEKNIGFLTIPHDYRPELRSILVSRTELETTYPFHEFGLRLPQQDDPGISLLSGCEEPTRYLRHTFELQKENLLHMQFLYRCPSLNWWELSPQSDEFRNRKKKGKERHSLRYPFAESAVITKRDVDYFRAWELSLMSFVFVEYKEGSFFCRGYFE